MWIFVKYGFYSIACASKADGSLDPEMVMIRGRRLDHMENLKARFPALVDCAVVVLANRDYRYRMITAKSVWVAVMKELAEEQTWSNFKNEAAGFAGAAGADYVDALHDVWSVMYRLQDR